MSETITTSALGDRRTDSTFPLQLLQTVLEAAALPLWVANKEGKLLVVNSRGREYLGLAINSDATALNVFQDLLKGDTKSIVQKLGAGEFEQEVEIAEKIVAAHPAAHA